MSCLVPLTLKMYSNDDEPRLVSCFWCKPYTYRPCFVEIWPIIPGGHSSNG